MTNRKLLCKEFCELTNGHWHEWEMYLDRDGNERFKCACGANLLRDQNPTYHNPTDVLRVMKLRGDWAMFLWVIGGNTSKGSTPASYKKFDYIDIDYILNPDALLKMAVEFLKERKNNE